LQNVPLCYGSKAEYLFAMYSVEGFPSGSISGVLARHCYLWNETSIICITYNRSVLSEIARFYDPLSLVEPAITRTKIFP